MVLQQDEDLRSRSLVNKMQAKVAPHPITYPLLIPRPKYLFFFQNVEAILARSEQVMGICQGKYA